MIKIPTQKVLRTAIYRDKQKKNPSGLQLAIDDVPLGTSDWAKSVEVNTKRSYEHGEDDAKIKSERWSSKVRMSAQFTQEPSNARCDVIAYTLQSNDHPLFLYSGLKTVQRTTCNYSCCKLRNSKIISHRITEAIYPEVAKYERKSN